MRLFAFALLLAVGCAPSADLRVPLPERASARGRLAIVRLGDVAVRPGDEDTVSAYADDFWKLLRTELSEQYAFDKVEIVEAPAGFDAPTLRILAQRAPLGSQAQGWARYSLRVLPDPVALAPLADVIVVVDTVHVAQGVVGNPLGFGVQIGRFSVAGPLPNGRGITVATDALVYRRGQPTPAGMGRISVYGRGSGLFENRVDGASTDRAIDGFAERLALHGGFARR